MAQIIRTINSPGVEVREQDFSQYALPPVGTNFLVMGFTDKGEEYNPLIISNIQDFETNYGTPTNEAERYSYYTAKDIIRNGGNLIFAKLPYNNTISNNYKYIGLSLDDGSTATSGASDSALNGVSAFFDYYSTVTVTTNEPNLITTTNYDIMKSAGGFDASVLTDLASYDYVIVNENKARIAGVNNDEGIFVAIVDPVDAMKAQRILTNSTEGDVFSIITGLAWPAGITTDDFETSLTGAYSGSSFSEDLAKQFPGIEYTSNGNSIDPYYSKQLGIIVCSAVENSNNEGKLQLGIIESYVGSIYPEAKDPATGNSIYLGDLINSNSNYIKWYNKISSGTFASTVPLSSNNNIVLYCPDYSYPLIGFTNAEAEKKIVGGSIVNNMQTVLEKVSNIDAIQIDVVVDAGLSTIAEFCNDTGISGSLYTPDTDADDTIIETSSDVEQWRAVCSELINFCKDVRKDCMTILDGPRHLVLQGAQKWIRKTAPSNTFSNKIGSKLRYITGLNSSYAALYINWMKTVDDFYGIPFWLPPSCKISGIYANNDRTANIWDAPAGLNRGIINGIVDLAFNPSIKEADQIYIKSINYAKQYPLDGFIIEGNKTCQVKPSAFDRVNVRRLFLRLERLVYQAAKYFVYEPNSSFTRRRLIDTIEPTFRAIKAAGGIYDYQIICDEKNNTAEVIDRNELKVACLIQPVKTAEFILIDFIAARTGANFDEIIQQL